MIVISMFCNWPHILSTLVKLQDNIVCLNSDSLAHHFFDIVLDFEENVIPQSMYSQIMYFMCPKVKHVHVLIT